MARKTTPKPWQIADLNFVEIEITHSTDTQMRIEFACGLRLVIASEEQIPLAARLVQTLRHVKGVGQ
jgi:hypothetical protein